MRYSNLFKVALVATTFFTSSSNLFAGKNDQPDQVEAEAASSIPAKLSIEDQLRHDYVNFSIGLMQWDHDQKEKAETAAPVAVPGLEAETREQAALRILLSMADAENNNNPLHHALIHKRADFTRLFLAQLGNEANSPALNLEKTKRSLLNLASEVFRETQNSDDAVLDTVLVLRKSQYKFDDKENPRLRFFSQWKTQECASLTFYKYEEPARKYIPLAILLGGDKSFITIHLSHSQQRDGQKKLHHALADAYQNLCENGLGHLIDINDSVQNAILEVRRGFNLDELQKKSAEVRQKKSQLQQLNEALERISKK